MRLIFYLMYFSLLHPSTVVCGLVLLVAGLTVLGVIDLGQNVVRHRGRSDRRVAVHWGTALTKKKKPGIAIFENQTEEKCFCEQTWKRASSLIGRRPPSLTFAAGSPGKRIKTYQNFGFGSHLIAKNGKTERATNEETKCFLLKTIMLSIMYRYLS